MTHSRLNRVPNMQKFKNLKIVSLRQNLICKIENLSCLDSLDQLDLYDNRLVKIEALPMNLK